MNLETTPDHHDHAADKDREGLDSGSFLGLLITQFLGATNDNAFRWLVIGIGKNYRPDQIGLILMAGTVCFVAPYLVLASVAGYLADRFSKRRVIIWCKVAEIAIMVLGVGAIIFGNIWLLFSAVAAMGAQSALFGPAKLGSIPEMLKATKISAANGLMGLTTVIATVIGMGIGCWLSDNTGSTGQDAPWLSAIVLIGIALVGWATSLLIRRLPAAAPERTFPWDMVSQTCRDLYTLGSKGPLLRVALGITFFWSIAAMAQLNIDQFVLEGGATEETDKLPLLFCLVFGVGFGSVLAGIWSCGRVELGIVPLGAIGVAFSSMLLFTVQGTIINPTGESLTLLFDAYTIGFVAACIMLAMLGTSAGLFDVPLAAYMQHHSPPESRGSILAASNFLTFAGMLLISLVYYGLRYPVHEGSLSNVPEISNLQVEPEERQRIDQIVEQFNQQWDDVSDDDPDLVLFTEGFEENSRLLLIGELVWTDVKHRYAFYREKGYKDVRGKKVDPRRTPDDYHKLFPDEQKPDKRMIKRVYHQATGLPLFTASQIFLLLGIITIPVFVYIIWLIPQATIRFIVWLAAHTCYRIRVIGHDNLPERGGALLVPNHVSWLDGVLLLLLSSRPIRVMVYKGNFKENGWLEWVAKLFGTIFIGSTPKSMIASLREANAALKNGELVCIFPEGGITRSGQIQAFRPGMMKVLKGAEVPVVPIYLDELWGSIFSFERGRFFWKWPRRWPYPISIFIGPPVEHPEDTHEIRQAVQELGATAVRERCDRMTTLPRSFIRECKRRKFKSKLADSAGADMKGGEVLMRALILRRLLRRHVLAEDEKYVGVLLPPVAGGVITNVTLAMDQRVAVNLNYTVTSEIMNRCIKKAGITHVLTSRKFMEKMNFDIDAELVYLEDFKDKVTTGDKISAAFGSYICPASSLERSLKLHKVSGNDELTIIFTSGSTGDPKGVMLTHGNIASNVEAIDQVVHLTDEDVLIGILPFFHSIGYTVTIWAVMGLGLKGAYHFNPLDAKVIGKLTEKHKGTILISTPTFLRTFLRRCTKEQFATLDVVVGGAEKLPPTLCDAFEEKFGVRPVEGYGTTELSPLTSVNIPPSRSIDNFQNDMKEGSVGRPIPGVTGKIRDIDSDKELGVNQAGMLYVAGPNVMKGYLNDQEKTDEVLKDGWYKTGDIATIDEEGFITITGRISRFSKIGGEMVPHIPIEDMLNEIIGLDEEAGLKLAVTSVPDPKKGERLVVVHTSIEQTPQELCQALKERNLPNLFIPSPDSFVEVDELPVLGTGKLDLRGIKEVALRKFPPA